MAKEGCDKNCATCDIGNRAYCAVQLGLKNQELLMNIRVDSGFDPYPNTG